jgi:hypothetical protein
MNLQVLAMKRKLPIGTRAMKYSMTMAIVPFASERLRQKCLQDAWLAGYREAKRDARFANNAGGKQ